MSLGLVEAMVREAEPIPRAATAQIGPYQLLEPLGEGGFGTVWMAEQGEPIRRRVALKILKPGMDSAQIVMRFEAERQALAMMDHPNIARVFDGGATDSGVPYFAMELVRGVSITTFCDTRRLQISERVELFIPVCLAIQHAHQKGIIHRDLKPSNLLVTEVDGTPVPKVVDFGIAKATQARLTDKTLLTQFHQLLGTPSYMSPEQASLGGLDVDSRSDIYSLGVLLFELVTGSLPLDPRRIATPGLEEMLRIIRETDPPKPSARLGSLSHEDLTEVAAERLTRSVGGDLDWIILKALEKDRNRRYDSAGALAADLARHLRGEPVSAVPPSLAYLTGKFARRHRTPLISAAALFSVLVGGMITTTLQAVRATRFAESESRARAAQSHLLYASEMSVALRSLDLGKVHRTRSILEKHRPAPGETDLRGWEWRYLLEQSKPSELAVLTNQPSFIGAVCYSADGQRLAVGYGAPGMIKTWDPRTRTMVAELDLGDAIVNALAYTPDRSGLFVALRTPEFLLLDGETLERRETFRGHRQRVCGVVLTPDGSTLITAAGDLYGQQGDAECFVWDTRTREIRFRMPPGPDAALQPQVSKSGRYLSRGMNNKGLVEVWDLQELRLLTRFKAHPRLVYNAAFSPDESQLVTCGDDGFVRLWDWRAREEIAQVGHHSGPAFDVAFHPAGHQIVSCGLDGTLRHWDAVSRHEQITFRGHLGRIHRLAYSPDGSEITSGGGPDRTLRVWDTRAQGPESELEVASESMVRAEFTPDSQALVVLRRNEEGTTLKAWDLRPTAETAKPRLLTEKHAERVVVGAPCGSHLALATAGSSLVTLLDLRTGLPFRELRSPVALVGPVACSRDAQWIAVRARDQQIVVWRVATGEQVARLQLGGVAGDGATTDQGAMTFSRDGASLWIATGSSSTAECLDWRQPTVRHRLQGHDRNVTSLALSPDGSQIATGSIDMSVRLWNAETGAPLAELAGESGGVMSLAFAPDGRTLAAGYFDGQLKLWNVSARTEMAAFPAHLSIVYSVAFSPDGTILASAGFDGVTRIWRAAPESRRADAL